MHVNDKSVDTLAGQLLSVFSTVMKSSQAPILQLTAEFDLTLSQLKMLFILANAERPLAVHELAEATGLSLPAAGRAVDALCRGQLVTRREDEADRRVKRVALSERGEQVANQISDARLATMSDFVAKLSAKQRGAFADALAPVLAQLPDRCATHATPKSPTDFEAKEMDTSR